MDADANVDADPDPDPDRTRRVVPAAVAVVLAAVALTTALGAAVVLGGPAGHPSPPGRAADSGVARFELSVTPATDWVAVVHAGGPAIDPARLGVRIVVDGEPIAHQPPVPFFAAQGFRSGPVGPFNSATRR